MHAIDETHCSLTRKSVYCENNFIEWIPQEGTVYASEESSFYEEDYRNGAIGASGQLVGFRQDETTSCGFTKDCRDFQGPVQHIRCNARQFNFERSIAPAHRHPSSTPATARKRRNARERFRVRAVNEAFGRLRQLIPSTSSGRARKRVSKRQTLKRAAEYIRELVARLAMDRATIQELPFRPEALPMFHNLRPAFAAD
ncbi:uncharacterized protein LOC118457168 [Anopheles albimanus]|uniref:Uncharacterized protein n=1 Tax=Anopheles albimanus TaxID=7167 RepID=A0A182FWJ2_ANOAL|nr:uncharacterized protein LOC118457168 [Anopheles albimanus]